METEKDTTYEKSDLMPRLAILSDPGRETSNNVEFELFFDLWFVASLQLLTESKDISQFEDLMDCIGFLCILWSTWFSVCMFDVRFMTDSVFERVIRTVHFGAMVGFIIVVSHFKPNDQMGDQPYGQTGEKHHNPFRTLCLILMTLRLALVVQYCSVYKYYWDRKDSKKAFAAAAMTHCVAAIIYAGITPRFDQQHNSRAHMVWYSVSAVEVILQLALAWKFDLLEIKGHKLPERLATLTVMILGEGVAKVGKNVFIIAENEGKGWEPSTIGICISAVASSYFLFLTYFDLLRNRANLKSWRQLLYSLLHFPFHVSLLLYSIGSATFIQWWHAYDTWIQQKYEMSKALNNDTIWEFDWSTYDNVSSAISEVLSNETNRLLSKFPIKYADQQKSINMAFENIREIPDSYWGFEDENYQSLEETSILTIEAVWASTLDSIFVHFGIGEHKDEKDHAKHLENPDDHTPPHIRLLKETQDLRRDFTTRAKAVFVYVFVCVGVVLICMTMLHIFTLTQHRWRSTDHIRIGLFFSASLALGLISIANTIIKEDSTIPPWCMPLICGIIFLLFLVTHLRPRLNHSRPKKLHWPCPLRLRTSSFKVPGHETQSLFESSVYHFDTHGQGNEYHNNGEVEMGPPNHYVSFQGPEYNSDHWPGNGNYPTHI